jgi:hypothetical protein
MQDTISDKHPSDDQHPCAQPVPQLVAQPVAQLVKTKTQKPKKEPMDRKESIAVIKHEIELSREASYSWVEEYLSQKINLTSLIKKIQRIQAKIYNLEIKLAQLNDLFDQENNDKPMDSDDD